ncbi:MAG: inositol monophosphatase family protein [Candidatus Thorarchaeota archaeon]
MALKKDLYKAVKIAKQTVLENLELSKIRTGSENPFGDKTRLLDKLTEDNVVESLQTSGITYTFLTEERGIIQPDGQPEYLVILDPIDGSFNLSRGIPIVAVGISAAPYSEIMTTDDVEISIIDSFFTDETFIAENGKGATRNGKPINPNRVRENPEMIISYNTKNMLEEDVGCKSLHTLMSVNDMRRTGCPLLDLCWTATGALDAMIDFRDKLPIIHVSGTHMVSSAGGYVLDLNGSRFCQSFDMYKRMSFIAARDENLARALHNTFMNIDS